MKMEQMIPEALERAERDRRELDKLDQLIAAAKEAQKYYSTFSQQQVDRIFEAVIAAAATECVPLAELAIEETGMGKLEDKATKNQLVSEFFPGNCRYAKTCGAVGEDAGGNMVLAEGIGVVAGFVPTTNPTSMTIFMTLMALKTRNAVILSPHPKAQKCIAAAAELVHRAAVAAGAPEGLITRIENPNVALCERLMNHPGIALGVVAGGPRLLAAAQAGTVPVVGVAPGNTPVVIDESCRLRTAVGSIMVSKTFDNGMSWVAEQSIIAVGTAHDRVKDELLRHGAYILSKWQAVKIGAILRPNGRLNPQVIGRNAADIAALAGVKVPDTAKLLVAEVDGVGPEYPFSGEKLSPLLALYRAPGFDEALTLARKLVEYDGIPYSSVLYIDPEKTDKIERFKKQMAMPRTLVNMPSNQNVLNELGRVLLARLLNKKTVNARKTA